VHQSRNVVKGNGGGNGDYKIELVSYLRRLLVQICQRGPFLFLFLLFQREIEFVSEIEIVQHRVS